MAIGMIESIYRYMLFVKKYRDLDYGDSFFRYRKLNSYTIAALRKDELWGTLASEMPDKDDCSVTMKRLENENYFNKPFQAVVSNYYRNSKYLVCLTFDERNEQMWNQYADFYKGIVLEYDVKELLCAVNNYIIDFYSQVSFSYKNQNSLKEALIEYDYGISKVAYTNEPIDISDGFSHCMQNMNEEDRNESDIIRNLKLNSLIVSTKREKYSFENEIRLVLPSGYNHHTQEDLQKHKPLFILKPKTIILGKWMSDSNKKILSEIGSQNEIDVIDNCKHLLKKRGA